MSNIVLCGFARVGKSTLAKKIAKKMNYFYIDTDALISEDCRKFYQEFGEEIFRKIEKKIVYIIQHLTKSVIACGGGTVLDAYNVSLFKKNGKIIYLDFDKELIKKRVLKKPWPLFFFSSERQLQNHPPLSSIFQSREVLQPPLEEFEEIFLKRSLIYKSIADIVVHNEEQLWEVIRLGTSSLSPHGENHMEKRSELSLMDVLQG